MKFLWVKTLSLQCTDFGFEEEAQMGQTVICSNKRFQLHCIGLHVTWHMPCWTGTYAVLTRHHWNSFAHKWKAENQRKCIHVQRKVLCQEETQRHGLIPWIHTGWINEGRRKPITCLPWFSSTTALSCVWFCMAQRCCCLLPTQKDCMITPTDWKDCMITPPALHLGAVVRCCYRKIILSVIERHLKVSLKAQSTLAHKGKVLSD